MCSSWGTSDKCVSATLCMGKAKQCVCLCPWLRGEQPTSHIDGTVVIKDT